MVKIFIEVLEPGLIKREYVSAYLFTKLSARYHDTGLSRYFNGSGVKAHTFSVDVGLKKAGDVFVLDVRGIEPIEKKFSDVIKVGESIELGRLRGRVIAVDERAYKKKDAYAIDTPLIMRYDGSADGATTGGSVTGYFAEKGIVASMDKKLWETVVMDSLKRKAELVYGYEVVEEYGDVRVACLSCLDKKVSLKMHGVFLEYNAMMGSVKIVGDDFWHDFALRVGLGNRNTYGFGVIG